MPLKLVVDANILFSFFKQDSTTRKLITKFEFFELYSPQLAIEELKKYRNLICEKAHIHEKEFEEIVEYLRIFVNFVPEDFFKEFLHEAKEISPDMDDVAYFALALKLGCAIWSNDKRLKQQRKVKIISTKELMEMFSIL